MHAATKAKRSIVRRNALIAVILAAAIALAGAIGSYAAYAAGLSQANYTWFTPGAGDYVLSRPGDIYAFAEIVNGTQPSAINGGKPYSFEGETIHIATGRTPDISDISDPMLKDPTGIAGQLPLNVLGTKYEFEPIGTEENPFQGTFDGGGVTLLDMLIDQNAPAAADPRGLGLFGVVGEHGCIKNFTVTGNIAVKTGVPVDNLGGAAGLVLGTMEGVHSRVNITIENTAATSIEGDAATTTSMTNIGGVAGRVAQSISNCTYDASLIIKSDLDAAENDGTAPIPTAKYIAGVVGVLGSTTEATPGVSATGCYNYGDIYTPFTGSGGEDNWGVEISAKPSTIGGIAGYSTGSLYNCGNEGEIRTSARLADSGGATSAATKKYDSTFDNGASIVGGVVGSLRTSRNYMVADLGSKEDVLKIQDCYNVGAVIGSDRCGGICGDAGTYTLITGCANGNRLAANSNKELDNNTVPESQGLVLTTRWNKPYGAGIVSDTYGSISYCYNRGEVNNTQSGYYQAGIAGIIGASSDAFAQFLSTKDDPTYQSECYGCYNVGPIGPGHSVNVRYGALLGENNGYIHDCAIREGCVGVSNDVSSDYTDQYNSSFAIGANMWNQYDNLVVYTMDELCTATPTGVLNTCCASDGGYAPDSLRYWFSGKGTGEPDANRNDNYNDGFPVLTTWATPQNTTPLNAARLSELSVQDAVFQAAAEPIPAVGLSYTQDSGVTVELHQNADYLIVPETGAFKRTDTGVGDSQPYKYSVQGIGLYSGYVSDFGHYGITIGSLNDMTVVINRADEDKQKFNWEVQFPNTLEVFDSTGGVFSEENYDWVIYDSQTANPSGLTAPKMPVFDSRGWVKFSNGDEIDALSARYRINKGHEAFEVYDRNGLLISDSDGFVYDEFGNLISGKQITLTKTSVDGYTVAYQPTVGYSCMAYREAVSATSGGNSGPAGYVVEIQGKGDYEGAVTSGQFVIEPAQLDRDCEVSFEMPDSGVYHYSFDEDAFYHLDESAAMIWGNPEIDFEASSIRPSVRITYLGRELQEQQSSYIVQNQVTSYLTQMGWDIAVGNGGYEVSNSIYDFTPDGLRNRNATYEGSGYGAASNVGSGPMLYVNDYLEVVPYTRAFQGFVNLDFNINQVSCKDVEINAAKETGVPSDAEKDEGIESTIESPITLTLAGNVLREGMDYELRYYDSKGDALVSENDEEQLVYMAPSKPGTYTVEVRMLPLNFTDDFSDVGIESCYEFEVVEARRFKVQTEHREMDAIPGTFDLTGDYIPDAQWAPGNIVPDITFLSLDENGDVSTDSEGKAIEYDGLQFGRDYVFEIRYSLGLKPLNVTDDYYADSFEPFPYLEGQWVAFKAPQWVMGKRSLYVTIKGRGLFAGCEETVNWLLMPIPLEDTDIADWDFGSIIATRGTSEAAKERSVVTSSCIKYQGYNVNYDVLKFVELVTDPQEPVRAGDVCSLSLHGLSAFTGYKDIGATCTIEPFDITTENMYAPILSSSTYTFDGTYQVPSISIRSLVQGVDYFTEYFDNRDAGVARVAIVGDYTHSQGASGNYRGTKFVTFSIAPRKITDDSIAISPIPDQSFTGDEIRPSVTITDNGLAEGHDPLLEELVEGRDYVLEYADNVDAGVATVFIKGIGNYTGTVTRTFNIETDPTAVRVYVEFAYALDNGRKVAATASALVDATALPDYTEDGDGFAYEMDARDFVDSYSVLADGTEVHTINGKQFKLQGDRTKTIQLGLRAKNIVTFEYLNQNPDGTFETMPQVEGIVVDKVMRASDAYAVATIYPTTLSQNVEWKSSDVEIASVDASTGLIHVGEKAGVVKLTATSVYDREQSADLYLANAGPSPRTVTQGAYSVTGVPEQVRLVMSASDQANSWLGVYDTMLACFDIRFETDVMDVNGNVVDTVEVQPATSVNIQVALPDGITVENLYQSKCFAYHYADDGSLIEPLSVTSQSASIVFKLNHFSHVEIFGTIYDEEGNLIPPVETATPVVRDPIQVPGQVLPPLLTQTSGSNIQTSGGSGQTSGDIYTEQGGSSGGGGALPSTSQGSTASVASVSDDDTAEIASVSDDEPLADTGDDAFTFGNAQEPFDTFADSDDALDADDAIAIDWPLVIPVVILVLAIAGGIGYNIYRIRRGKSAS